jgi:hypothetical protein
MKTGKRMKTGRSMKMESSRAVYAAVGSQIEWDGRMGDESRIGTEFKRDGRS